MKKGIALLAAAGILFSMALPVSAAEEITTFKGDQELTLTEAGDVDLTKEELIEKTQNVLESAEDFAMFMKMDVEASMSIETEEEPMTMDIAIKADMTDNKNGGLEYKSEKMTMSFFGMDMDQISEEYIFPNAQGVSVSVKKESSSEAGEEDGGEWVAEVVSEMEDLEEDVEGSTEIDTVVSDDMFETFELLDKKYTDGEKEYYVLKAKTADVMGNGFEDLEEMFGEVNSDKECYLLIAEDGMLESMFIDLGDIQGSISAEEGVETSFSNFVISVYTDKSSEIIIPEEVQAAGDAAA